VRDTHFSRQLYRFQRGVSIHGVGCYQSEHDKQGAMFGSLLQQLMKNTRGGTRTRNLLLRREAPYPLGHTSNCSLKTFYDAVEQFIFRSDDRRTVQRRAQNEVSRSVGRPDCRSVCRLVHNHPSLSSRKNILEMHFCFEDFVFSEICEDNQNYARPGDARRSQAKRSQAKPGEFGNS
jgi:hypothetical protein